MKKKFICILFLTLAINIGGFQTAYGQNNNSQKKVNKKESTEKLIKDKPSVYISFEKFGKRKPVGDDESEDKVWLRLYNNTRWSIHFCIFNAYDKDGNGLAVEDVVELGINYKVEKTPQFYTIGILEDGQQVRKDDLPIPRGMPTIHTCSLYELASGKSVLFNVERRELAENLRIKIKFNFDWEEPTDFSGLIPVHYVYYNLPNNRK